MPTKARTTVTINARHRLLLTRLTVVAVVAACAYHRQARCTWYGVPHRPLPESGSTIRTIQGVLHLRRNVKAGSHRRRESEGGTVRGKHWCWRPWSWTARRRRGTRTLEPPPFSHRRRRLDPFGDRRTRWWSISVSRAGRGTSPPLGDRPLDLATLRSIVCDSEILGKGKRLRASVSPCRHRSTPKMVLSPSTVSRVCLSACSSST